MEYHSVVLFVAGFLGGMLNSIAGGGTFITFPALIYVGVPPIQANATNTFASCSGYITGLHALRKELAACRDELPKYILLSLLGGVAGAWLLMQTPEDTFRGMIPWLLLLATLLFVFGNQMNQMARKMAHRHRYAPAVGKIVLLFLLVAICLYGGFFNAGLGIITLSYLALAGQSNISTMNGIKLLISTFVSIVAVVLFAIKGAIAWQEGLIVLLGSATGGYLAAHISRNLPQKVIRIIVVVVGFYTTGWFLVDAYM